MHERARGQGTRCSKAKRPSGMSVDLWMAASTMLEQINNDPTRRSV